MGNSNPLMGGASGNFGIGQQGLCDFANEMNDKRAQVGERERYKTVMVNGKLTLDRYTLPSDVSRYTRSSICRPPQDRFSTSQEGQDA